MQPPAVFCGGGRAQGNRFRPLDLCLHLTNITFTSMPSIIGSADQICTLGRPYIGWTDRSRAASSMGHASCLPVRAGQYLVEKIIPSATQQCHLPQRPQDVAYMWRQTAGTLPKTVRCTLYHSARCDVICESLIHQRAAASRHLRVAILRCICLTLVPSTERIVTVLLSKIKRAPKSHLRVVLKRCTRSRTEVSLTARNVTTTLLQFHEESTLDLTAIRIRPASSCSDCLLCTRISLGLYRFARLAMTCYPKLPHADAAACKYC